MLFACQSIMFAFYKNGYQCQTLKPFQFFFFFSHEWYSNENWGISCIDNHMIGKGII